MDCIAYHKTTDSNDVHEMNAHRSDSWTDFDEMWYGRYASGGYPSNNYFIPYNR